MSLAVRLRGIADMLAGLHPSDIVTMTAIERDLREIAAGLPAEAEVEAYPQAQRDAWPGNVIPVDFVAKKRVG